MPNVHGIEFSTNQSELVKDLIREILKDGNCAVYALHNMKPNGELRLASTAREPLQENTVEFFSGFAPANEKRFSFVR
jgi:hypothetical protein